MMIIGTMGFDGAITAVVLASAVLVILTLHLFWIVATLRYRGAGSRLVRRVGIAYMISPFLVGGMFVLSVGLKPLVHCNEPLGGDFRQMGYVLAWVVLGSLIALSGLIVLALQPSWKPEKTEAEPATAPYSEPAARAPQG